MMLKTGDSRQQCGAALFSDEKMTRHKIKEAPVLRTGRVGDQGAPAAFLRKPRSICFLVVCFIIKDIIGVTSIKTNPGLGLADTTMSRINSEVFCIARATVFDIL